MADTFHVRFYDGQPVRIGDTSYWRVYADDVSKVPFPTEYAAFDLDEEYRENATKPHILYIDDNIQLMVAIDYLLERGWELDLSRCCSQFLSLYGVEAVA